MTNIYSGFFLEEGGHCTWEFNPGKCQLPCMENDEVKLVVIGKYADDEIACDVVEVHLPDGKILTHQATGTVLHVTTWFAEGVSPVQSGIRATKNGYETLSEPMELKAKAGFFRA